MRPHPDSALRRSTAPFSALLSALALTPSLADTATGVFADRDATLLSLAAARLNDARPGAHVAGTRVTSVLVLTPTTATAHMEIGIWSAPHSVFHPGDEESPGFFTTERSYLGGISLDQSAVYGQSPKAIHQPFDVSVVVPAGNFYFYAGRSVATGGSTDPSRGTGGPVFADTTSTADFDHTLRFDLTTSDGATLSSESGQFLTAVPEPGSWAVLSGLALAGWAVARQRRDPRVASTSAAPPR